MRASAALVLHAAAWLVLAGCSEGEEAFAFTADELEVHDQVNAYRESLGLPALEVDPFLGELARAHSDDMAAGRVPFGHEGFEDRATLILAEGATTAGENVAFNGGFADPNTEAVQGWIGSPPHEENMAGDFTHSGVGIVLDDDGMSWFTHLFSLRP